VNLLDKIKFILKKPKVIIVTGEGRKTAKEAIFQVVKGHFKIGGELLIYETDLQEFKDFEFLVKKSRLPVLVVTHVGEYHPEREFFAGELEQVSKITKLAEALPSHGYLILNFDDETVRDIKNKSQAHPLTFGFGARADIQATDIVLTGVPALGTNFKINYEGKIVPVWLERLFGKEQIYAALTAAGAGEALDLNLVEISGALKFYQGLPGRMRLIRGIKNSWVLDDSENASSLSMLEALEVLRKIEIPCLPAGRPARKIAVLGDILGIGKYSIEAHEAIGEKVKAAADLLFTAGPRTHFIAQGAKAKGMALEKIFQYDTVEALRIPLQNEIKENDLILIDGSSEMKMAEAVEEIKAP